MAWLDFEQGVEARSGHGSPAKWELSESDAADPSEVLPRRGKTSVPARNKTRQPRKGIMMNIIEEAKSLVSLVDYQDGSIVSKEVIKKEKGTVTLFAFDKGQGLSEHTAAFDALVYIFDGRAEINIAGKAYSLKAGETMIMPASKPHSLKAQERFKMFLVMIKA